MITGILFKNKKLQFSMGSNLSADSVFLSNPGMMTPPSLAAYLSLLLLPGKKSTESWARPCSDLLPWVQHRHGASTVLHGAKSNCTEQLLRSAKTHSQSEEARCQPPGPRACLNSPRVRLTQPERPPSAGDPEQHGFELHFQCGFFSTSTVL